MVSAVAIRSVFADETALSLYQKKFFLERYCHPALEAFPLIPEIIEEREITSDRGSCGYDRFGRVNRLPIKGVLVDSYH
jgi:hypothetical protein